MRSTTYAIILILMLSICPITGNAQNTQPLVAATHEVLLSGGDWKLGSYPMGEGEKQKAYSTTFEDRDFRPVTVPGEVQLQLGLKGMDRYYQIKELSTINEKEWWYRKQFVVPKEDRGKLLRLKFEGVDYYAAVWLNGEKLGEHEGAYVTFTYDVSPIVKFGAENTLVVKVTCPWMPTDRAFGEYLKGDWMMPDPSEMSLPYAPYVLGPYWGGIPAYGNAAFPMGLFRDVDLIVSGRAVVEDVFVRTEGLADDSSANLEITGTIRNYEAQEAVAELKLKIEPENFSGVALTLPSQTIKLQPGENVFRQKVTVKDAQLWWTWDLGKQNIYKLITALSAPGRPAQDTRITKFGIRTIDRHPDMSYWLNGKRLFLKGSWYPMSDYFASVTTEETYIEDLTMYRSMNLNLNVNFTVIEKPIFYDLCDQMGILLITELPFGQFGPLQALDPSYPRHQAFVKSALRQVEEIVVALRNHPSIIEWATYAEAHEKDSGGWGMGSASFAGFDYQGFSDAVAKLVTRSDPGVIYQPSLCDFGEQHFWMANAGMGSFGGGYQEHFNAVTGFVSEYGSLALPALESLRTWLAPADLWGEENRTLPQWFNLPISVPAYSYLASFEYAGFSGIVSYLNHFVDRDVRTAQEFVDDSQLYQAFIMKYATEAYRRKMHNPINGIRFWAYVEAAPGIQWGIVDYNRIPKMAYYFLKQAEAQFDLNFAYERALESQVSGTEMKIPVWIVNEHRREVPVNVQVAIVDLQGRKVWGKDFQATVTGDGSQQVGQVDWVTPDTPGVYVLKGQATEVGGKLHAEDRTFIKVTPKLLPRPARVLVIGESRYCVPIVAMLQAMGMKVEEIDAEDFHQLKALKDSSALKNSYDVVWLASFDSLWKMLSEDEARGLKQAVNEGLGFIHSGGPGSFHGGYGKGACLEFTSLAEMLPVTLMKQNDLVYGESTPPQRAGELGAGRVKEIGATGQSAAWDTSLLKKYGVAGFNEVELKPENTPILTISGRPLLVEGHYGQGRTLVFTGFTPEYTRDHALWNPKVVYPYMLDQETYLNPENKAYFDVFMRMMAEVTGAKPDVEYSRMLSTREKPLFQTLKEQAPAELKVPESLASKISGDEGQLSLKIENTSGYARLVRASVAWEGESAKTPYLVTYSDNYFDLLPGEVKTIDARILAPRGLQGEIKGKFTVQGSNVRPVVIPITLQAQ